MEEIRYIASPTARKFHASKALVRGIKGPVGSGKTVSCVNEIHRLAISQEPNSKGRRLTRVGIIRNTLNELRSTTLNTFSQWIPSQVCKIVYNPMIKAIINYTLPDETVVHCECIFVSLDRPEDTRKLLSLELTGVFINEAREIAEEILIAAKERVGRYPAMIDGYKTNNACTRKFIIMDTNPPSDMHYWFRMAEVETPKGYEFFSSPPPLIAQPNGTYTPNPLAENIKYLPGGYQYYFDLIEGSPRERINVMVLGNYGEARFGKPVYPEYNDILHCENTAIRQPLGILNGVPIGIGMDGGLTPCAVFGQITPQGQLRVFAELSSVDMDVMMFARDILKPFIAKNIDVDQIAFVHFDPSGVAGKENQINSAINMLNDNYVDESNRAPSLNLPFTVEPAITNNIERRLNAVKTFLSKLCINGQPGLVLSSECHMLRKGFMGGYSYKKLPNNPGMHSEKPLKNMASHTMDSLSYLALGFLGEIDTYNPDGYFTDNNLNEYNKSACGY